MRKRSAAVVAAGLMGSLTWAVPASAAPTVMVLAGQVTPDQQITAVASSAPVSAAVVTSSGRTACVVTGVNVACTPEGVWPVGQHALEVIGADGVISVPVLVAPAGYDPAIAAPAAVFSGRSVSVGLTGWNAPAAVSWELVSSAGVRVAGGSAEVDPTGRGSVTVSTEAGWSGRYRLVVSDGVTSESAVVDLVAWSADEVTVDLSSTTVTVGSEVTLSGTGFSTDSRLPVLVWVMTNGVTVMDRDVTVEDGGTIAEALAEVMSTPGTYRVRVMVGGLAGGVRVFSEFVTVTAPVTPMPAPEPVRPTVPPVSPTPVVVVSEPADTPVDTHDDEDEFEELGDPASLAGAASLPAVGGTAGGGSGDLVDDDSADDLVASGGPDRVTLESAADRGGDKSAGSGWIAGAGFSAAVAGALTVWWLVLARRRRDDENNEGEHHDGA